MNGSPHFQHYARTLRRVRFVEYLRFEQMRRQAIRHCLGLH